LLLQQSLRKPNNFDKQTKLNVAYSPNEHIPYSPDDHAKQVSNLGLLKPITASFVSCFYASQVIQILKRKN
jgi:hypothetical protein